MGVDGASRLRNFESHLVEIWLNLIAPDLIYMHYCCRCGWHCRTAAIERSLKRVVPSTARIP